MTVPNSQLERLVALLTIGLSVAIERGKMSTPVANQILFSPHAMSLLRAAGVRESVVELVQNGTEIEDIESLLPVELGAELGSLRERALEALDGCAQYDFEAEKWIVQLLGAPLCESDPAAASEA